MSIRTHRGVADIIAGSKSIEIRFAKSTLPDKNVTARHRIMHCPGVPRGAKHVGELRQRCRHQGMTATALGYGKTNTF